jgi:hypothetical protein
MILFIFDIFVNLKNFATPCPVPDIGTPDHQVPWFDPLLWIVVALDANFAHGGMVRLQQKGPVNRLNEATAGWKPRGPGVGDRDVSTTLHRPSDDCASLNMTDR